MYIDCEAQACQAVDMLLHRLVWKDDHKPGDLAKLVAAGLQLDIQEDL